MSEADWAGSTREIGELQAFDAMRAFLEAYWERGGKQSADLAGLLGSLNRHIGPPLDVALWYDWKEAVDLVLTDS